MKFTKDLENTNKQLNLSPVSQEENTKVSKSQSYEKSYNGHVLESLHEKLAECQKKRAQVGFIIREISEVLKK